MLEFEEYKVKLNGIRPDLDGLGAALKLDEARAEIAELEAESAKEGFWNNLDRSQKVQKRIKQLQQKCEKYEKLQSSWDDLMTICEMALEENDDSMLAALRRVRREQRHTVHPPRRGRDGGPGLGADAL